MGVEQRDEGSEQERTREPDVKGGGARMVESRMKCSYSYVLIVIQGTNEINKHPRLGSIRAYHLVGIIQLLRAVRYQE
jgi:hypothetical protein